MFTRIGNSSEFDSVMVTKGKMFLPAVDGPMQAQLLMMYVNKETGISYGYCKMTQDLMSPDTIDLLNKFLLSAEEDFGNLVFGEGIPNSRSSGSVNSAENPTGSLSQDSLGGV